MTYAAECLSQLPVDETTIRLDCTPEWLERNAHRLALGGIHLATEEDVDGLGFKVGAIVPDVPVPLTQADVRWLEPFCADEQTPASLCVGFGVLPDGAAIARSALAEASAPGFRWDNSVVRALGTCEGRLKDILHSRPNVRTTIVQKPDQEQPFEPFVPGAVGLHYDNGFRTVDGRVENIERFTRASRVQRAARRLLYNAGPGPRRSLVGLCLSALHLADVVHPGAGSYTPNTGDLRKYLAGHPDKVERAVYLAITLQPGDMMLLPAGNAMHDGSMEGCPEPSTAVVFTGHFPRHAFAA